MDRVLPFVWLDVFASTPLEGNQLAVFPDAHGLTETEMQAIAREMHLSETTFVFPGPAEEDAREGFRTRIFTVYAELPFAGHPTLGTAYVLSETRGLPEVALRLKVGRIPVAFTTRSGQRFGEMRQNEPVLGATHDRTAVARAVGARPEDLDPAVPVQTVSTGVPFAIVPFRDAGVLSRLRPSWPAMEEYLNGSDAGLFYLIARNPGGSAAAVHARMVFSAGEDPATGSAAGPALAWMVLHGWARPDEEVVIEQGVEMHRPSRIHGRAALRDGRASNVRVGGYCTKVIEGELRR